MKTYTILHHELMQEVNKGRSIRLPNPSSNDQIKKNVREDALENIILDDKYDMSDPKIRKAIADGLKEAIKIVLGMRG